MRQIILIWAALSLSASVAMAQDAPAQREPQNPAIKSMHDNNSNAPVAGANSFTRNEAIKQIESKGFTHVIRLKKDKDGVWRGRATKDGHTRSISADYQGNVN